MIAIKTPEQIERMCVSNQIAAKVRDSLVLKVCPRLTTAEIDEYAAELIKEHGARSAFLGYRGFPGHVCVSVNEEVVHGVPGKRRIEMGDIVSIDVGIQYDGYIGDTTTTVMVGVVDPEVVRLVKTTEMALMAGVKAAREGNRLSDISNAIESVAIEAGFRVVRQFVGHGIGRKMHEDPEIPNFGPPGKGPKLLNGMTLALEPMINMGCAEVEVQQDGWTVVTCDRKPSAHFEHTIAICDSCARILSS